MYLRWGAAGRRAENAGLSQRLLRWLSGDIEEKGMYERLSDVFGWESEASRWFGRRRLVFHVTGCRWRVCSPYQATGEAERLYGRRESDLAASLRMKGEDRKE